MAQSEVKIMIESLQDDIRYIRSTVAKTGERLASVEAKLSFMPLKEDMITTNDVDARIEIGLGAHASRCKSSRVTKSTRGIDSELKRTLIIGLIAALMTTAAAFGGYYSAKNISAQAAALSGR